MRLEAHEAEVEPALRAHRDVTEQRDGDQQQYTDGIQPWRDGTQDAWWHLRDREHHAEAEPDACRLAQEHSDVLARGTEQYDQAGHAHGQHREQQRTVEVQRLEHTAGHCERALCAARVAWACDVDPHSSPSGTGAASIAGVAAPWCSAGSR